jgi:simple sugar transport system permease protein
VSRFRISPKQAPLLATSLVCLLLYVAASLAYPGFFSGRVFVNLLNDNAFLGIASVGMTFVILAGGIDLSVGSVIGCASILIATLVGKGGHAPVPVLLETLALGALFGAGMGVLIWKFELPSFLVTLAGMFLARGAGLVISLESVPIEDPLLTKLSGMTLLLPVPALIFLACFFAAVFLARSTTFGRNVYALGGNPISALLMGLPVGRTTVLVYAFSGFCSALAGVTYALYTLSGNASAGMGLELDAIAAAVIGGTLLSGGVGYVTGTLLGVLILGIIQTAITFQGTLSSWWTRIAIGLLLLAFILLQRVLQRKTS